MPLGTKLVAGKDDNHQAPSDVVVAQERRHLRVGRTWPGHERAHREVRQGRLSHQGVGQARQRSLRDRRVFDPARARGDSRGRLFVGDRDNNRIQITTGRKVPRMLVPVRPPERDPHRRRRQHLRHRLRIERRLLPRARITPIQDWRRGIRIGSAKDGSVRYLIPDPYVNAKRGRAPSEGVAAEKGRQGHLRRRGRPDESSSATTDGERAGGQRRRARRSADRLRPEIVFVGVRDACGHDAAGLQAASRPCPRASERARRSPERRPGAAERLVAVELVDDSTTSRPTRCWNRRAVILVAPP